MSFLPKIIFGFLFPCLCLASSPPQSATVPLTVVHNRAYVNVDFTLSDGKQRKALFWIDNGNPDFLIRESLGRDLGLDVPPPEKDAEGLMASHVKLPAMAIGGMPIETEGASPKVIIGESHVFAEKQAEGILPSTILKNYEVKFDYPARQFTIARSGTLKPHGKQMEGSVQNTTGLLIMKAIIDGKDYDVALDMGSAFTLVSEELARKWTNEHPTWPRLTGAVGTANMFAAPYEAASTLVRVPEVAFGSSHIKNVAMAGTPQDFFDWYSKKTSRPVMAVIGGNVLQSSGFVIDYPRNAVYIERQVRLPQNEFDLIGLVLAPSRDRDGRFGVRAVATRDEHPVAEGIEKGDKLLQIDGVDTAGLGMQDVIDKLRGKPGDTHKLLLQRAGKQVTVEVRVAHLL